MYQLNKILSLVFILSLFSALGQVKFNAPYSSEGIGEVNNTGLTFQKGMAGLGVATSSVQFINLTNPALLARTRYTAMDFGFNGMTRHLKEGTQSQTNTDLTLGNIILTFPIHKTWTTSIGLSPYSTVNYQINKETIVPNTTTLATNEDIGTGGISKFHFSNGIHVFQDSITKSRIYLGLETAYLFGLVEQTNRVQLTVDGIQDVYYTQQSTRKSYSDFIFRPALALRKEFGMRKEQERETVTYKRNRPYYQYDTLSTSKYVNAKKVIIVDGEETIEEGETSAQGTYKLYLKKEEIHKGKVTRIYEPISIKKYLTAKRTKILVDTLVTVEKLFRKDSLNQGSGVFVNLGFVYEKNSQLKTDYVFATERYDAKTTFGSLISSDTILNGTGNTILPTRYQVGLSFDKPLPKGNTIQGDLKNHVWSIGADFSYTQWSQYKDVFDNQNLKNTYKATIGGEYVPNLLSTKLFNRTIYRFGAYYGTLPYQLTEEIKDFGISFGMSLPMGPFSKKKLPKYINIAFNYGQRGDFNNKLIKEHYFATSLSFTVNNKWFRRYKVGL